MAIIYTQTWLACAVMPLCGYGRAFWAQRKRMGVGAKNRFSEHRRQAFLLTFGKAHVVNDPMTQRDLADPSDPMTQRDPVEFNDPSDPVKFNDPTRPSDPARPSDPVLTQPSHMLID